MRHTHSDGDDREATLPELFWSVARSLRQMSASSLAQWEITPSQARALHVLARHGPIRLSELSAHLHIAARSVTEVVDGLEEKRLVRRRADPHDRRATLAELTDHGHSVTTAMHAARSSESEQTFNRLTAREREELARLLRKLRG